MEIDADVVQSQPGPILIVPEGSSIASNSISTLAEENQQLKTRIARLVDLVKELEQSRSARGSISGLLSPRALRPVERPLEDPPASARGGAALNQHINRIRQSRAPGVVQQSASFAPRTAPVLASPRGVVAPPSSASLATPPVPPSAPTIVRPPLRREGHVPPALAAPARALLKSSSLPVHAPVPAVLPLSAAPPSRIPRSPRGGLASPRGVRAPDSAAVAGAAARQPQQRAAATRTTRQSGSASSVTQSVAQSLSHPRRDAQASNRSHGAQPRAPSGTRFPVARIGGSQPVSKEVPTPAVPALALAATTASEAPAHTGAASVEAGVSAAQPVQQQRPVIPTLKLGGITTFSGLVDD